MDTRRLILAIVLMIAVIVVTNLLFPPVAPEHPAETEAPGVGVAAPAAPAPVAPPAAIPAPAGTAPPVDTLVATSPLFRYGFSTAGASVVLIELLRFQSFTRPATSPGSPPVELVEPGLGPLVRYGLEASGRTLSLDTLRFTALRRADTLRFNHEDPASGLSIELNYGIPRDSYLVNVWGTVRTGGGGPAVLGVQLGPTLRINERTPADDERALAYVVNSRREGIRSTSLGSVQAERVEEGPLAWVALKNKYFLTAAISPFEDPAQQFGGAIARPVGIPHAAAITATLPLDREGRFAFQLYLGPQEYNQLAAVGRNLEDVNPYGWRFLRPVIRPLAHVVTWALVAMHRILGIGYGWVLIAFGFLVRIVLWPLNARAMRSQLKSMELQPRMKEIQEKYRAEPERLQKEMLRLYKEEGFNPLGGCLPVLIPFPVLITLFFVFQSTIEFRGVRFLWFPDLSQPDPLYILPVLLGGSMFLMQWISMRSTPVPNPQMKMMLWFMPAMMLVIFFRLASGLNLYYFSMNIASVPQQLQLMRERRRVQGRLQVAAPGGAPERPTTALSRDGKTGARPDARPPSDRTRGTTPRRTRPKRH